MRWVILSVVFCTGPFTSSAEEVGLRLGVEHFAASYSAGDWLGAGDRWLELEGVFASEPEWEVCVKRYSGAAGLALLFSERAADALRVIEQKLSHPSYGDDLWLLWLRAVSLEVLERNEEAKASYILVADQSGDPAAVMLARLRAAIIGKDTVGLEQIATTGGVLPSVRHAARFHLLRLLSEAGKPVTAAEVVLTEVDDPMLIARPGLWHGLMRNVVIGSVEAGADAVASLVGDRIQPPQVLQREISARRAGLRDDRQSLDGTLRGNIRAEYLRRLRKGMAADQVLAEESAANWLQFQLFMAEVYARAGRKVEATVLWEEVYAESPMAQATAERALLGLLSLAVSGDSVAAVDAARRRYETAFADGELRSEAVALVAWWYYRAGRDRRARETIHAYLRHDPEAAGRQPRLLLLSAYAALRLGEVDGARLDLTRARQCGIEDIVQRVRLAEALCTTMEGGIEQALEQLRELRQEVRSPALLAEVYRQSLRVMFSSGRWRQGLGLVEHYREQLEMDVPWPELPLLEGDILVRLGDIGGAHTAYSRAVEPGSQHIAAAVVRRARLYVRVSDWQGVVGLLDGRLGDGTFDGREEVVEALWLCMSAKEKLGSGNDAIAVLNRWLPLVLGLPETVDSLWLWRRIHNEGWLGKDSRAIDVWYENHLTVQSGGRPNRHCDRGRLHVSWAGHAIADGREQRGLELLCEWSAGVDPQCLAADVLAAAGERLVELGDPAGEAFLATLDCEFPDSRHRAAADVYFANRTMGEGDLGEALERYERAAVRAADPRLLFEATIGKARVLRGDGQLSAATEVLEGCLVDRRFRGHCHARALLLLGQWAADDGQLVRARGYFSRLVLLYPSFGDITHSAQLELNRLGFPAVGAVPGEKAVVL